MRVPFGALMKNYPSNRVVSRDTLFQQIGWDDLIKNSDYGNTCAIRVSLALIRSGITIPGGRIPIRTGALKGKMIEPGQAKLSMILSRPTMLGKPEKLSGSGMIEDVGHRSGIVSFFRLSPGIYEGGHIDIVAPQLGGMQVCGSACYWTSKEVWFWPLR